MHVVSSWVMAFGLLNLATTYCTLEPSFLPAFSFDESMDNDSNASSSENKVGALLGDGFTFQGKPLATPVGIPPFISMSMSLAEVAAEWRRPKYSSTQPNSTTECAVSYTCSFKWFGNVGEPHVDPTVLSKHEVENVGWSVVKDRSKVGFAPVSGLHSKVVWSFDESASSGAKTIVVVAMKSYGEKWANSTTSLNVFKVGDDGEGTKELIASSVILGYHAKTTSISSAHALRLNETLLAESVKGLRLEFVLTAGSTAKIMGLAICD